MRTAIIVAAILFASWLTGIVSHSMFAFVTVLGSASLVATALKIDSVAKRRAKRRRLAWDAAYQHNAYMAGYDKLGTEGRYPSSAADLPAMGASVPQMVTDVQQRIRRDALTFGIDADLVDRHFPAEPLDESIRNNT